MSGVTRRRYGLAAGTRNWGRSAIWWGSATWGGAGTWWGAGLILLGLTGCGGPNAEVAGKFREAQRVFDTAESPRDFLRAAGIYQEIREAGVVSGAALYNQGNAYLRAGRRGRAIACYRQAQQFRPRDLQLQSNLRLALGDEPRPPRRWWAPGVFFWQSWLSYREKIWTCSLLVIATLALATGGILAARPKRWWWATIAVSLLVVVGLLSVALDWYRFEFQTHGVLVREPVVARKGSGETYDSAFERPLPEGTEFELVRRRGRWLLIRLEGRPPSWVRSEDVALY